MGRNTPETAAGRLPTGATHVAADVAALPNGTDDDASASALTARYGAVRAVTGGLARDLTDADASVQSMDDASPAKWHLAHTTWFFETFILEPMLAGYQRFDDRFGYLFNSYYEAVGARHPRPRRGMLTRPTLDAVRAYRAYVDAGIADWIATRPDADGVDLLILGLNHEQQHQELLLTDILHLFAQNPLKPAFRKPEPLPVRAGPAPALAWVGFEGGLREIGHDGAGFGFDCEFPRHQALLQPFRLASRPVTNGEWRDFIDDGGYRDHRHWLSDGWDRVRREDWEAPLYWERRDNAWWTMSLRGMQTVDDAAPVAHVSYFEADAFARWAGKRLPTEFEWEHAATDLARVGNFAGSGRLRPAAAPEDPGDGPGLRQMFGDVWELTASPYVAYPGFRPAPGAVGEYNGKFMSGQWVMRGGSCATPAGHVRASYRNFFQPEKRWQFSGLRLAEDA